MLFFFSFRNSDRRRSGEANTVDANKEDGAKVETVIGVTNGSIGTIEIYPEFCRSQKEKECWKLFQKMLVKGVKVSYDTILRGMLTPTELRAVQKQKTLDEQRQNEEAEAAAAEAAEASSSSSGSNNNS